MAQGGTLSGLEQLTGPALARSAGLRIDDWSAWWAGATRPAALLELVVIAGCGLLAWLLSYLLRRALGLTQGRAPILLGRRGLDGALFPLAWLGLTWAARGAMLRLELATPLFRIALPALVALAIIRVAVKVLQASLPGSHGVRVLERTLSWMIWLALVLWVSGLLPVLLEEAEDIGWTLGGARLSLRSMIEGAVNVGVALLLALWLSSAIEGRLLRSAVGSQLSVRKGIANALRALLIVVAVTVSLTAVGIDLTALSVLGGAIGVGIGLGLQKLAANYVSGFMVLAERSVRIGDLVRVAGFEGHITDIRARFTVIRSLGGAEAIVPNETLMTSVVENLSLSDRRVHQSTSVGVGYDSDVDLVQRLLTEAALESPRVLHDPAPSALLSRFGADGLEFTVGYWLADPENGLGGPRSHINLAILRRLREHGIEIPFPQRVLRQVPDVAPAPAAALQ